MAYYVLKLLEGLVYPRCIVKAAYPVKQGNLSANMVFHQQAEIPFFFSVVWRENLTINVTIQLHETLQSKKTELNAVEHGYSLHSKM